MKSCDGVLKENIENPGGMFSLGGGEIHVRSNEPIKKYVIIYLWKKNTFQRMNMKKT